MICPKVAADNATNDTESTIDATDATETIVLDDKIDWISNDDDDLEFYLYKGPSAPFTLWKFPRNINNNATTANEAKTAVNGAMITFDPMILPRDNPFCNQLMTHKNLMRFQELAFSSFTRHTLDDKDSTNSDLDYFQEEDNDYKLVDLYDFVHDTDPYTPMDIPQESDEYYSYLDKHYSVFDNDYSITHM